MTKIKLEEKICDLQKQIKELKVEPVSSEIEATEKIVELQEQIEELKNTPWDGEVRVVMSEKKYKLTIPDRKDFSRMLVWNYDCDKRVNRVVLFINKNGSCRTVRPVFEKDFFAERDFEIDTYQHCEPIPEARWRAFKDGEMPEYFKDYWYRKRGSSQMFRTSGFMISGGVKGLLQIDWCWYTSETLFVAFERQTNNEWLPVGVRAE